MNTRELMIIGVCIAGPALIGCAADGGFASKTKPVDLKVSLDRVCIGLGAADVVAKRVLAVRVASGQSDPQDLEVEAGVTKVLGDFCNPDAPPTDLAGALAAAGVALVDAATLQAKLAH